MRCSCKAEMCYVCGAPLRGKWSDHFGPGKCSLMMDTNKFNQRAILQAKKLALKQLKEQGAAIPETLKKDAAASVKKPKAPKGKKRKRS